MNDVVELQAALNRTDELARQLMERSCAPAFSVAITDRKQTIHLATFGHAEVESRTRLGPDHLFEFGSIGKSFTAVLLLQLAGEGRVDLHAPVADYLPWFSVRSEFEPITIHHLLCHSAGITRGTDFPADPRYEVWALRDTFAATPPGQRFHYSNAGYKALGVLIEHLTGQSYAELVRDRILEPLGMHATEPAITNEIRSKLVRGYAPRYDDRPWRPEHGYVPATWLETNTADGCIASTPQDLAIYLRMLMNGGHLGDATILDDCAFRAMTTPHIDPKAISSGGDRYGYGLAVRYEGERLASIGHGGGMVGYYALMQADLQAGFGIVTMTTGHIDQQQLGALALSALAAAANGDELPELPEMPDRFAVESASELAGEYVGADGTITLETGDNHLYLLLDGVRRALESRGDSAFIVHADGEWSLFPLHASRDENGNVVKMQHGSRTFTRAGQTAEPATPIPEEWRAFAGHYRSHNPWQSNFRVLLRDGELLLAGASGWEERLLPIGPATFQVGSEDNPETISFDTVVDGEAWRAIYSAAPYYRFFTP